jgi:hypothetical protein
MSLVPELIEYGPDSKYGEAVGPFGHGKFWGTIGSDATEDEKRLFTLKMGYSHGCPRPELVIDTYGVDYAWRRYSAVNRTHSLTVVQEARGYNFNIFQDLTRPVTRQLPDEPVGLHEATAVPEAFKDIIPPMTRLEGYALPRLYILRAGSNGAHTQTEFLRRENTQLALRTNIAQSNNALEVLAKFVRYLGNQSDLERADIFHHVFPAGVLEEENCYGTFDKLARLLDQWAPEMRDFYTQLTPSQMIEKQIAFVSYLKTR